MILRPDLARAVFSGRKTETRRVVRPDENRCRYRPGHDYAICPGPGATAIGRIIVVHVDRQRLGDIRHADAIAEGHTGRHPIAGFARCWLERHDPGYRPALTDATDDEVIDRWRSRHADRAVWVITFIPDPAAQVRLLAARSEFGYTRLRAQAIADEPEAVDAWTQAGITRDANHRDQERQTMTASIRRTRLRNDITDLQQRLLAARLRARRDGTDRTTAEALRLADAQLRRAADTITGQEPAR